MEASLIFSSGTAAFEKRMTSKEGLKAFTGVWR